MPLVTFDPYLSIWSDADTLTERNHGALDAHREHSLASLIRIDGKAYRLMGAEPKAVPAFKQVSLQVSPTRSVYEFEEAGVHVTLTFMTAALPHDLDIFSRPLSYLTWMSAPLTAQNMKFPFTTAPAPKSWSTKTRSWSNGRGSRPAS